MSTGVYVIGSTPGHLDGNTNAGSDDIFVAKFNAFGVKQWTRQLGTPQSDQGLGAATDQDNNIFVVGQTEGGLDGHSNAGQTDIFVVKYNSSGAILWTRQLGSAGTDQGRGAATDTAGNVYVVGDARGALDGNTQIGGDDFFVVKYNGEGVKQWSHLFGTTANDGAFAVATSGNNIYVTGFTYGGVGGNTVAGAADMFTTNIFASTGTTQWTRQLGTNGVEEGNGVAVDKDGSAYIVGRTTGNLDGNTLVGGSADAFLTKYGLP